MEPDWSTRQTFERYLYDYLVKKNMHHTAEIFRNEANLQLDPAAASTNNAMDVPEGFLLEWWSLNSDFDFFRTWLQMKDTKGLEATQGCNASQEAGCSMNAEALNQLPDGFTPVEAFSIGSNVMPSHVTGELPSLYLPSSHGEVRGELPQLFTSSHREVSGDLSQFLLPYSHQEVIGEFPQLLAPSSHQEELLTDTVRTDNVANTNGPEVEPFVQNASKAEYNAFVEETDPVIENLLNSFWLFEPDLPSLFDKSPVGESSRNMENLLAGGEGNTSMNAFAGPPAPKDDDNKSETSDCSSRFRIITSDADSSMAHQLESNEET